MSKMYSEILSQPEVLERIYKKNRAAIEVAAAEIEKRAPRCLFLCGRGSSDNACLYFKYLCEIHAGIPVSLVYPSILTLYGGRPDMAGGVLILVSQGGRSADTLSVAEYAKQCGALIITITNDEKSPLADAADICLPLLADEEFSMAATKTVTAEMLTLGLLALALAKEDVSVFEQLPALVGGVLALADRASALSDRYVQADSLYVLARGYNLAAAREVCCKLQETCFINANAFSAADFMHGPFALMEKGVRALLLVSDGPAKKDALDMLARLDENGVDTLVISNLDELAERGIVVPYSTDMLSPFLFVCTGQLLACSLSEKRGINPDCSRNLNKYTVTK